jgi:hypothetical protein
MSRMPAVRAETTARLATLLFAASGMLGWLLFVRDWRTSLPLAVFYTTLVINTYFSIRLFSQITPADNYLQKTINIILGLLYLWLAFTFHSLPLFVGGATLLFAVAALKYILLRRQVRQPLLLQRKITVDGLGFFACGLMLAATFSNYTFGASWLWALTFVIANIWLLAIFPLYRLDNQRGS